MRIAVITSRATSLMNVSKDIAYVVKKLKHTPILLDYAVNPYDLKRMANASIIVMTMNPLACRTWFLLSRDANQLGIPSFVYTTTEGKLPFRYVKDWMRRDILFVANSKYTANRLEEVGLNVMDTVYHGVNLDEVELALKYRDVFRKQIEDRVGKGVIFGIVATNHPRKGLDRFSDVVRLVREQSKEAKFYIVSTPMVAMHYSGIEGVYVDTNFGKRSKAEVLGLISAFDFYIQPSLAEGFGLPVLEAMAVGVPAIHLAYEPLTEFSIPEANLWIPYKQVIYNSFGEGIDYELHIYDSKDFVSAILDAIDMIKNRKSEYEDRSSKAQETAKKYDIMKLYPKLLDLLKQVEEMISKR